LVLLFPIQLQGRRGNQKRALWLLSFQGWVKKARLDFGIPGKVPGVPKFPLFNQGFILIFSLFQGWFWEPKVGLCCLKELTSKVLGQTEGARTLVKFLWVWGFFPGRSSRERGCPENFPFPF